MIFSHLLLLLLFHHNQSHGNSHLISWTHSSREVIFFLRKFIFKNSIHASISFFLSCYLCIIPSPNCFFSMSDKHIQLIFSLSLSHSFLWNFFLNHSNCCNFPLRFPEKDFHVKVSKFQFENLHVVEFEIHMMVHLFLSQTYRWWWKRSKRADCDASNWCSTAKSYIWCRPKRWRSEFRRQHLSMRLLCSAMDCQTADNSLNDMMNHLVLNYQVSR